MSSEEESKWMERRRKVLKKLRAKKMSRRGGTQWMDTSPTTTATNSKRSSWSSVGSEAAGSSKRTSVRNEAAPSLCSWDPSTEQAINIGLMGYEDAIIEEAEEEEKSETAVLDIKLDQEPQTDDDLSETRSESTPSEVLSDTKSEYTDSFISQDTSEDESSATDFDSMGEGHSTVEVSFDVLDTKIGADARTLSDRSSISSFGSGYDVVVDHHAFYFGESDKARTTARAAISESSLESLDY